METATRKIEKQANQFIDLSNQIPPKQPQLSIPSYTSILSKPGEWNLVTNNKTSKQNPQKKEDISSKRLILINPIIPHPMSFSSLQIRNQINEAFEKTGIKGPVIAAISTSTNNNIIITTNNPFTSQFLIEKKAIWDQILKSERIQKDQPWHKVIIHKIPINDFSGPNGMDLIKDEIKTFNSDFSIIGTPYWLTSSSKRNTQREGAIVIAFATEKEAELAIRKRLYIAGISVRVEKFYHSTPSSQCQKCQGFGHHESFCRKPPACGLCSNKHSTTGHLCIVCLTKGKPCQHLMIKCANCQGDHKSNSKSCEIYQATLKKSN